MKPPKEHYLQMCFLEERATLSTRNLTWGRSRRQVHRANINMYDTLLLTHSPHSVPCLSTSTCTLLSCVHKAKIRCGRTLSAKATINTSRSHHGPSCARSGSIVSPNVMANYRIRPKQLFVPFGDSRKAAHCFYSVETCYVIFTNGLRLDIPNSSLPRVALVGHLQRKIKKMAQYRLPMRS